MSVYFLAQIKISDEQEYQKYLDECDDVFKEFNGEYLAVDSSPELLEGSWDFARAVIIKFPSAGDFHSWYQSEKYQKILKHRLAGSISNSILVHGQ